MSSLSVENLLLQAKTAILEEKVRRFHALQAEGRWQEALQQFQATLQCAADVLEDSLKLMEQATKKTVPPTSA